MNIKSVTHKSRISGGVSHGPRIQAQFEGAGQGYRMGNKGLGTGGINHELSRSLSALRRRSIHAIRNHAYAKTACNTYVDNLVGTGITAKWADPILQALWDCWIKHCDADGLDNIGGLQALVGRESFSGGESLTKRRFVSINEHPGIVPLRLHVLPSHQLDERFNDPFRNIVQGVQFSSDGERMFYHLNQSGDISPLASLNRIRVPAADIIHLFDRTEAGQVRGVPELSAILVRLYEIDEMQDAMLVRAKVAALFGGFISRKTPQGGLPQESNQVAGATGDVGQQVGETDDGAPIEKITPGGLHYLYDDETIEFPDLPDIGANHTVWLKTELRASAKAAGMTYEQLTGDLEGVSFSALKFGMLDFRRRIERLQWNLMIARWCEKVARWFADAAVMAGMVSLPGYWSNPHAYMPTWIPPKFESADRLKDVMADVIEMRAGLETRRDKVAQRGNDIDRVDEQFAKEQSSELVFDSNPAVTDKNGGLQDALNMASTLLQSEQEENAK